MSDVCLTCGGMILTMQDGAVGYAGPVCTCYAPPKIQRPSRNANVFVQEIRKGKPAPYPDDDLIKLLDERDLLRELLKDAMETLSVYEGISAQRGSESQSRYSAAAEALERINKKLGELKK